MRQLRLGRLLRIFREATNLEVQTNFGIARLTCRRCIGAMIRPLVGRKQSATCGHIWLRSHANQRQRRSPQVF